VICGFFFIQVSYAKPLLKEALQAEVGLPVDGDIPVIGFIGRLEEQKGSDILASAIPMLVKYNVQIIVLVSVKVQHFLLLCYAAVMPKCLSLMTGSVVSFRELAKNTWKSRLPSSRKSTLTRSEEWHCLMSPWPI